MSKQAKINSIEVEIGDTKVTMTLAQAKELMDVLNQTFGGTHITQLVKEYPLIPPSRPYRGPYWSAEYRASGSMLLSAK